MVKDKVYLEGSTRKSLIVGQNDSSRSGRSEAGSAFGVSAHEFAYGDRLRIDVGFNQ
jgi:hypothetical protein